MARTYTASTALDATVASSEGGDTTTTFPPKVNTRFTDILGFLNTAIPNENHVIPASPTSGYFLQATDANTLAWASVAQVIRIGAGSTSYSENDLIIDDATDKLYVVNTAYTSGGSFDPASANLTLVSGLTEAESEAAIIDHFRFTTNYSDSAPTRTYTVVDGKRYFIDALAGGITAEDFQVPDLSGATTEFEFTIMPRERDFATNNLTISRNSSDSSAQFFTMADPTAIIADDITIVTNGVYQFIGRRESSQSKWTVIKLDYN